LDREGIVRAVSTALERLGVNIVSLETTCSSAPFSGSPLFHLEAHIDLPESIALSALRSELSEVGSSENLDIEVHAKGRGGDH
jgi:glycine cleavage system transcriptional repressor